MHVPFMPVRGLLGTDYMKARPDFVAIANPYDPGEEIAVVPAIAPDVAVFHGFRGDRAGNVVTWGRLDAKLIAQAARRVIATVEEIAEGDLARQPHAGVLIPGIHVSAVVHVPRGCHPTGCLGQYGDDPEHIAEYMRLASSDEGMRDYLARYVLGTADHAGYLERVAAAPATAAGR